MNKNFFTFRTYFRRIFPALITVMKKKRIILILSAIFIPGLLMLPPVKTCCSGLLLRSTAFLMNIFSDNIFTLFSSGQYINSDGSVVLNSSCSGFNLLLFNLAAVFILLLNRKDRPGKIIVFLLLVPFYTLFLNIIRIILSIFIIRQEDLIPFLYQARYRIHQFIGILISVISLLVIFFIMRRKNIYENKR